MIEHLFINALALAGGLFIGYMRAKEKYETLNRSLLVLNNKKIAELKNIVEHMKNLALENMESTSHDVDAIKDFTELASLAESAETILYG